MNNEINFPKIFADARAGLFKKDKREIKRNIRQLNSLDKTDLFEIKGFGEKTVKELMLHNVSTKKELIKYGYVNCSTKLKLNPLQMKAIKVFFNK